MKWLGRAAIGFAICIAFLTALSIWAVHSESGARLLSVLAREALGDRLELGRVEGTLAGPLTLASIRYRDPAAGIALAAERVDVDVEWSHLLQRIVHVRALAITGLDVSLPEPKLRQDRKVQQDPQRFNLWPPIDVTIDAFKLSNASIRREQAQILAITEAMIAGRWTAQELLAGKGSGSFQWYAGGRTYAGNMQVVAVDERADLLLELNSPLTARLDLSLEQRNELPWKFRLEVPRFDPYQQFASGTKWHSLAAALKGRGTLAQGKVSGRIVIDDEPLQIDTLKFVRHEQLIDVSGLLRPDAAGEIRLSARLQHSEQGSRANADVQWRDGVQDSATLVAKADIELKPHIVWNVHAQASQFDPGVLLPAWRGNLSFSLDSEGNMLNDAPHGSMRLAGLRGHLRGRRIAGEADLRLTPQRVVAGSLAIESGGSQLKFHGRPGESMDAVVTLDVASMSDLMPNSQGALSAHALVRGRWPEISVEGDARGHGIVIANTKLDSLALDVDVENWNSPRGSARAQLAGLAVAGLRFDSLIARAAGSSDKYELDLNAHGEPLSTRLVLRGAHSSQGWLGSVDALMIDVKDLARLRLREPVNVAYEKNELDVSRACLADGEIELCTSARMQADGELRADYSLRSVPLALAKMLMPTALPVSIAGTIEGRGEVHRTAHGMLFGNASISSRAGRITQNSERAAGSGETLLSYDDLRITANVAGAEARASLAARLDESGSLSGELVLAGLDESTTIDGRVSANIPNLALLTVLAPQLANVQGRAEVNAVVRGTLRDPQITARLDARELAASVPAVGLQLTNGRLQVTPDAAGRLQFSGSIESGEGQLDFDGQGSIDGEIDLRIRGERLLAADIPGARVLVTPKLHFVRADGRMMLSGDVDVPQATVDLQNLPRSERAARNSRDVVVVDDPVAQVRTEPVPLYADVTVTLGPDIDLVGFGMQARASGRLTVREVPGEPTVGSGQLEVTGTFTAHDRELTIQRGRLLYAASPLDDPTLDLVASREVGELTAGLRIAGTAKAPEVSIFSEPPMSQADALSYLLVDRPLDRIAPWGTGAEGEEGEEGDLMQGAMRSLGTAVGGLLAQNVGQRLGIDAVAVRDDAMIGGSALTIGQYLSPRLYLSYGVGLFEPGEVVTLRYRLRQGLVVQAQRGPEHSTVGVKLRIER